MKPYERAAKISLLLELEERIRKKRRDVHVSQRSFNHRIQELQEIEGSIDNAKDELFVMINALKELEEVVGIKAEDATPEERSGIYRLR